MTTGAVKIGVGIMTFSNQKKSNLRIFNSQKVLKGFADMGKLCSTMNNDLVVPHFVPLDG